MAVFIFFLSLNNCKRKERVCNFNGDTVIQRIPVLLILEQDFESKFLLFPIIDCEQLHIPICPNNVVVRLKDSLNLQYTLIITDKKQLFISLKIPHYQTIIIMEPYQV